MATKTIYLNSANHNWLKEQETEENSISKLINKLIEAKRNSVGSSVDIPALTQKANEVLDEPQQLKFNTFKEAEKAFQDKLISYKELNRLKFQFSA